MKAASLLQSPGLRWGLCLVLLTSVAAFLRLDTATQRPMWLDESITLKEVRRAGSLLEIHRNALGLFAADTPPLYTMLAFLAMKVSDSLLGLRLPAIVSGILTVPALALLGERLFGRAVGAVSALLLALSVYHIDYSQDARPYALFLLLTVVSLLSLVAYLQTRRPSWLPLLVIATTASLYTHHFTLFYQACAAVVVLLAVGRHRGAQESRAGDRTPGLRSWLPALGIAYVVVALAYLPMAAGLTRFLESQTPDGGPLFSLRITWRMVLELFGRWGNGVRWSLAYAACLLVGMLHVARRRDVSLLVVPWFMVPFAVFAAHPFAKFFDIRYLMGSLPAFFLLVGLGLATLASLPSRAAQARLSGAACARWVQAPALVVVTAAFSYLSLGTYCRFRGTAERCSSFFAKPQVLKADDCFCEQYIVLNSLYPLHGFLVREHPAPGE